MRSEEGRSMDNPDPYCVDHLILELLLSQN